MDENEDICGLCGELGANKFAHPVHWPGEEIPEGPSVHAECEAQEGYLMGRLGNGQNQLMLQKKTNEEFQMKTD